MLIAHRLTRVYLLLMAGFFPLFVTGSGYGSITRDKTICFFALSGLYLLLLGVLWLLRQRRFCPRAALKSMNHADKAMAAFLLLALVSALCSPYDDVLWQGAGRNGGMAALLIYGALFFAVSRHGRAEIAQLYAVSAALIISGVIAICQLAGGNPLGLYPPGYDYFDGGTRYLGAFLGSVGNINLLSAWFCLCLPLLLAAVWRLRHTLRVWQMIMLGAAAAISIYVLLESAVSSGIFALTLTLLLAWPLILPLNFAGGRKAARRSYALWLLCLLLPLLAAFLLLWFYGGESGMIYEASQILHGNFDGSFGSSRLEIWQDTLRLVAERPWLGSGPGTISLRLDVVFSRIGENGAMLTSRADNAHNVYLQLAAELGLPALLAYVLAGGALLLGWLRNRGQSAAIAGLGAAVLCYAIQDVFNLGLIVTQPLLWLAAALLHSELRQAREKLAKKSEPLGP